jgi:hypothetical protein
MTCSGFGGFSHGACAAGFYTSIAVDVIAKMSGLHKVVTPGDQSSVPMVLMGVSNVVGAV